MRAAIPLSLLPMPGKISERRYFIFKGFFDRRAIAVGCRGIFKLEEELFEFALPFLIMLLALFKMVIASLGREYF